MLSQPIRLWHLTDKTYIKANIEFKTKQDKQNRARTFDMKNFMGSLD